MLHIILVGLAMVSGEYCSEPPSMRLLGDQSYFMDCGENYVERGASASTPCAPSEEAGNLTDLIEISVWYKEKVNDVFQEVPRVDGDRPGYYEVRYYVEDYSDPPRSASKTRTVRVFAYVDFTLNGDQNVDWECGVPYDDVGASAISTCLGDLSHLVEVSGIDQLISAEVGRTYTLTYSLAHPQLSQVLQLQRFVTIVDTLEPALALKGLGEDTDLQLRKGEHCIDELIENITTDDYIIAWYYCEQPLWWDQNKPRPLLCLDCIPPIVPDPTCRTHPNITLPIPGEQFLLQAYQAKYGTTPPVNLPTNWDVLERDPIDGINPSEPDDFPNGVFPGETPVPYPWYCDEGYKDPGVEVWDDCEGRIGDEKVVIILTRYLVHATNAYWAQYCIDDIPYHREVFQWVGTLEELPTAGVFLEEPGRYPYQGVNPATGNLEDYWLTWGGYRAYYFTQDSQGNPQSGVLETIRSRFIRPDYKPIWSGLTDATIQCRDPYFNLLEGITLRDQCVGDITSSISVTGDFYPDIPGTYRVLYDGSNIYGMHYSGTRTIKIVDTSPPNLQFLDETRAPATPVPPQRYVNNYIPWCVWRDGIRNGADGTTDGKIRWDWWRDWFLIQPFQGFEAFDACEGDVTPSVYLMGEELLRQSLEFMDEASSHLGAENPQDWDIRSYVNMAPGDINGIYPLVFSYKDISLNEATDKRVINVMPTYPEITFTVASPVVAECGGVPVVFPIPDIWDVTADNTYQCSTAPGDIYIDTQIDNIDMYQPGTYEATYFAKNALWNTDTATFTVEVRDTLPPVFVVNPDTVEWETGASFDFQAQDVVTVTAQDQCSGPLVPVLVDDGGMDFGAPRTGRYELIFIATDDSGNVGSATLTVNVKSPYPEIFLMGDNPMTLECGDTFEEPGYEAVAPDGNDLTDAVEESGVVNANQTGVYSITYNVVSDRGTPAEPVTRTVFVKDTTLPELTLTGLTTIDVALNGTFNDPGAVAVDACGNVNLTDAIEISGNVNTSVLGRYTLTYRVTDSSGNVATETRLVRVGTNEKPELWLTGANPLQVECGTVFSDPGAKAIDKEDGDLTADIEIEGDTVDTQVPGSYSLQYKVTDSQGNTSMPVTRTVTVADTVGPKIILTGDNPLKIQYGGKYEDPGATAVDACEGDLSDAIGLEGDTVDTNTAGRYLVRYVVTDQNANKGEATRVVEVLGVAVVVPDLTGLSTEEAQEMLTSAKLKLGSVGTQYSDTIPKDRIVSQNPMAGSAIPSGSKVTITLSKGPQGSVEPPPEGEVAEGEGEEEPSPGCCGRHAEKASESLKRMLGDYLLFGLALVSLLGISQGKS